MVLSLTHVFNSPICSDEAAHLLDKCSIEDCWGHTSHTAVGCVHASAPPIPPPPPPVPLPPPLCVPVALTDMVVGCVAGVVWVIYGVCDVVAAMNGKSWCWCC